MIAARVMMLNVPHYYSASVETIISPERVITTSVLKTKAPYLASKEERPFFLPPSALFMTREHRPILLVPKSE